MRDPIIQAAMRRYSTARSLQEALAAVGCEVALRVVSSWYSGRAKPVTARRAALLGLLGSDAGAEAMRIVAADLDAIDAVLRGLELDASVHRELARRLDSIRRALEVVGG